MSYIKSPTDFTKPWTSVMPFTDDLTVFEPKTLAVAVNFTIAPTPPIPGSMVIYRLIGDGVTVPTIDPTIVQIATTLPYQKSAGVVNTLMVWYDGGGYWYQWIRAGLVLPPLAPVGLTILQILPLTHIVHPTLEPLAARQRPHKPFPPEKTGRSLSCSVAVHWSACTTPTAPPL
jgi:hypothetical protein